MAIHADVSRSAFLLSNRCHRISIYSAKGSSSSTSLGEQTSLANDSIQKNFLNQFSAKGSASSKLNGDEQVTPLYVDVPHLVSDNEDSDISDVDEKEQELPLNGNGNVRKTVAENLYKKYTQFSGATKYSVEEKGTKDNDVKGPTTQQIKDERSHIMRLIVGYIAVKINNRSPMENSFQTNTKGLPLERFLLILTSRLQLTLPLFLKGIVYFFRYMDLIYLLRYLNQSNNFANSTAMEFPVKELLIGCFKLALEREHISKNWSEVTGLTYNQLGGIVKALTTRMNGKLGIKKAEVTKLRLEVYRYVRSITVVV